MHLTKTQRRRLQRELAEARRTAGTFKPRRSTSGQILAQREAELADMRVQIREHGRHVVGVGIKPRGKPTSPRLEQSARRAQEALALLDE